MLRLRKRLQKHGASGERACPPGSEDGGCDGPLQSGRRCRTCDTGSDPSVPFPMKPAPSLLLIGAVVGFLAAPSCFWVDATILVTDEVAPCPLGPSFDPRYNRTGTQ